jgi:tetratricopeptide (TPR) repeat protein
MAELANLQFRIQDAIDAFTKALQINPNDTAVAHDLIRAKDIATTMKVLDDLESNQEQEQVIKVADQILQQLPDLVQVRIKKAKALLNLRRYQEAIKEAEYVLRLNSSSPEALEVRAKALLETGNKDEALKSVNQALQLDPDNPTLMSMRKDLKQQAQRTEGSTSQSVA